MRDDLSVSDAAEALGTSPQTVRALLRKGELRGERRPWGNRYVWVPSRTGVDEFLATYGRLDGRRRSRQIRPAQLENASAAARQEDGWTTKRTVPAPTSVGPAAPVGTDRGHSAERRDTRTFLLRPRGRATVVVLVLGVPLLLAYVATRVLPGAMWFDEVGQGNVFGRTAAARTALYLLAAGAAGFFFAANLLVAAGRSKIARSRAGQVSLVATAVFVANLFGSAAVAHWQTLLLWFYQQPFGVADPIYGKDIGFFVFTLPFELVISGLWLWLVLTTAGVMVLVYRANGDLGIRPIRATVRARRHFGALGSLLLLATAWKFHLARYTLELSQPGGLDGNSFAGVSYVDDRVRLPTLTVLSILAAGGAVYCLVAPFQSRAKQSPRRRRYVAGLATGVVLATTLAVAWIPALVQRFVVDPHPLIAEQPYLARAISATRAGLALDTIDIQPYRPTESFGAADFLPATARLDNVLTWDSSLLEQRMFELVTDTPYYRPQRPSLDVLEVEGQSQLTVVSTRELDLDSVETADSWSNSRLAYTHGLGLIRFSGTDIGETREPRLIDADVKGSASRIYFGSYSPASTPGSDGGDDGGDEESDEESDEERTNEDSPPRSTLGQQGGDLPWVLANTRRPEVDVPATQGLSAAEYHYTGSGGIQLSSWVDRALFAVALRSKDLLLSDDVTPESRIMLHRDVHDRLGTLAPFIQWDSEAVPLTANGRIVFVVDGYTTSANYPYAERVELGNARVNYARASVRATVDAFSGQVDVYLTDDSEPIARTWAAVFPTLFQPESEMPEELRTRLRYPRDLFNAQASAYERFHNTQPDLFVSDADAWSRPIGLSGPLEVAGGVDFDESDEDDLRLTLEPEYSLGAPPGQVDAQLVLGTYYAPRGGQNLVGSLSGWIDDQGSARLSAWSLPRDSLTLGPAQISRLVFATPRVRNLLGLRNLEIRDLDKSSLDSVRLGRPHVLFLPTGVIQIQSLYEGSRGAGAARLLGVTAYVNGRAGLGPDIHSAVRQALNMPPQLHVPSPRTAVVGEPLELSFDVENAQREKVTITSEGKTRHSRLTVVTGQGSVIWVPTAAGDAQVRVTVWGLDGTRVAANQEFEVLNAPPIIRLVRAPKNAIVGEPVRVAFHVSDGVDELARVSTRSGVVFERQFLIREGRGVIQWTPEEPGDAEVLIRVRGRQGQTVTKKLPITVEAADEDESSPLVTFINVPDRLVVGQASSFLFDAGGCDKAIARIEIPNGKTKTWTFACPARKAAFGWTTRTPGSYVVTVTAKGGKTSTSTSIRLKALNP